MQTTIPDERPYKKAPTQEVIQILKMPYNAKELRLIQYEFYYRFASYIYKCSFQKCRNFKNPEDLSRDILQETFRNAIKSIQSFSFPDTVLDPIDYERSVKAWLGRIATNEFMKAKAKFENNHLDNDLLNFKEPLGNLFNDLYDEPIEQMPNEFKTKLQIAMNQLSEKDKDIILTYASEGCIKSKPQIHLSPEKMKYLCETYNTTSENIRQRKKRALDKIITICFNTITP